MNPLLYVHESVLTLLPKQVNLLSFLSIPARGDRGGELDSIQLSQRRYGSEGSFDSQSQRTFARRV